jgi:hypothetical protein
MKRNSTGNRFTALVFAVAGLLFLIAPTGWAQAQAQPQENIAQDNVANVPPNVAPQDMTGNNGMEPSADDSHDPPSRVARLSFLDGSVSMQPGGAGDWGAAAKNRPVTIGDKLWTDKDSRAELQAGQASIHVGSMTALSFLNLDQNVIQMRLAEGHLNLRVRELREGENYEIDTPNLAFTVREAGAFRVDVNENGDYTSVTVIRGKGEVAAAGQTYPVNAGERADISGTDANAKYIPGTASEPDQLDRWAQERNIKEDQSPSARYVSRDTVGYSDLDENGTWKQDPEVGNVWVPNNVPQDWAPYSDGNWSYVAPWGWTWVGAEPWGFAPYHYGRWLNFGGYWGWCPGPIYASPFYGPAFVGFLGGGFGFGVGFGFGWFPLGWGEPFHPWYHCGGGYWHNVNVYNTHFNHFNSFNGNGVRNFNYRYAHDTHAVTTASHNAFVNGQAINRGAAHLTAASLNGAHVVGGVNASPTHSSYLGASNTRGNVARPSNGVENRSVVARSAPASAALHIPVRTMNSSALSANHGSNPSTGNVGHQTVGAQGLSNARQSQLSTNRPPTYAQSQSSRTTGSINNNTSRPATNGRTWNAQGSTTDSGRAPQGFGSQNRPATSQTARLNSSNRPPWAGNGAANTSRNLPSGGNSASRPPAAYNGGNRTYRPPSNYGGAPNRNYPAPRSYSAPPSRNFSAPRSYSAPPSRNYSAPRSYSAPHPSNGGGGSHVSSGGGGSHASGGGGFHGGGGGGSHGGHH